MSTTELLHHWLEHVKDPEVLQQLTQLAENGDQASIDDAFFQHLEFGTAGLRGIIGAGTNRMNIYTVGRATQGLATYLTTHTPADRAPRVAIARDNRLKGQEFVEYAASVLAASGIEVFIYPRIEPTPALSFAVRDLECDAGICMTASHNPASYNGYKVYGSDGCQIASEIAQAISEAIEGIDYFTDVATLDFEDAVAQGTISWIDDSTIDRFIEAVHKAGFEAPDAKQVPLAVAYSPLHGTGLECMKRIFEDEGIDASFVVEQLAADGNFPTCPYPNPETKDALDLGIHTAREHNCDIVLATDPDADRVGIAVRAEEDYKLLTGNEVGILMMDYLCRAKQEAGLLPDDSVVVSTIVSTAMIDALAETWGVTVRRVLTGFKYIGEIIAELEEAGAVERFMVGFEESYGYLTGPHVRDKDAINAGLVICQMARFYKQQGESLYQVMQRLYDTYGYYRNRTINVAFPGAEGAQRMSSLMRKLREQPPTTLAGMDVTSVIDYQDGYDDLPPANVIEFNMAQGCKIIIRPSGTEPKVKAYLFSRAKTDVLAHELLDVFEAEANKLLG